ncbi:hypothetical protein VTK56DRAFT_3700 [Thermocarpiscus australiensis]
MIESHHFVVGSPKFSRRKSNKFLFGKFEALSLSDLRTKLEGMTLHRDIIVVGHGVWRELAVLRRVNIDLRPRYIIDTTKAAQHPLQLSYRYSLENLLAELDIPFRDLHVSGNDAHFALRALLMVTVRDARTPIGCFCALKLAANAPSNCLRSIVASREGVPGASHRQGHPS